MQYFAFAFNLFFQTNFVNDLKNGPNNPFPLCKDFFLVCISCIDDETNHVCVKHDAS